MPDTVTRYQLKSALVALAGSAAGSTLLDNVNAWVATQPAATQLAWSDAAQVARSGALVAAMAAHFGWASSAVDGYFEAAIAIPTAV